MKKFELYLNNDNSLVLSEFKSIESEYERREFRGKETYELIKKLSSSKLVDLGEIKRKNLLILEYKNYVIHINDYTDVLKKRGIGPLLKNMKDYKERSALKQIEKKKVKRKNKHVGKMVVAAGLTVLMLTAVSNNLIYTEDSVVYYNANNTSSSFVQVEDEFINLSETSEETIKPVSLTFKDESSDVNIEYEDEVSSITIDYEDRSSAEKADITKSNYSEILTKYANMYGVDPILAIAVATQESGVHSSVTSLGGATGLMQIQNDVWLDKPVSAYNFETNTRESFIVTLDKIKDLEYNIKIGCMILQNSLQYMKYNTIAAIQCYNMEYGNMMDILSRYATESNKTVDQILANPEDIGWLSYRKYINEGDQEYIENVLSWIGETVKLKNVKYDGSLIDINIDNNLNVKKYIN